MVIRTDERLRLSDFDYELPAEQIAQDPAGRRDASRLMLLDRSTGRVEHRRFTDIASCLRAGDLLVLNDTRVFPCRLAARKAGGGKAEIFLLEEIAVNRWNALVRGAGTPGAKLALSHGIEAELSGPLDGGGWSVVFRGISDMREVLEQIGSVPLPPYIRRLPDGSDRERYQTVYARHDGAVAAPTAGLHFTEDLLRVLQERGVGIATVTLHVGPGTFLPVRSEDLSLHRMHKERYAVPEETASGVNRAREEGRRVIAVGTTVVRTLESAADARGRVIPGEGTTGLFILPGYRFKVVDALITNFHLPKSTLLMLVAAFAGRETVLAAYRDAVLERYRFFSYGDAMFIS